MALLRNELESEINNCHSSSTSLLIPQKRRYFQNERKANFLLTSFHSVIFLRVKSKIILYSTFLLKNNRNTISLSFKQNNIHVE